MSSIPSEGMTPPAKLLRAHAPHPMPLAGFVSLYSRVIAGCDASLRQEGGSRRSLCVSFPRCLDPYPGGVSSAPPHDFPNTIGLPPVPLRSAHRKAPLGDCRAGVISALQSFADVQASRCAATQVAPTAVSTHEAAVAFPSEQNPGRYLPVHRIC
jgi:hypothetical protein